ncbi:MAG: sporulation protein [Oscillospiraceae bacterium]|nr:sporulation protein [Oscillospiraceae bacterium]
MSTIFRRKHIYDIAVCLALIIAVTALVFFPDESILAARDGLSLCLNVIIPSLFPFFVISALVVETGITRHLGKLLEPVMRPIFNVSGSCAAAFVLGFIGGYPVGAKTVISLYENGDCTKTEAERLLSFCNNSGPAFIFGVVGAGVFSSGVIGLVLYLAHTLASLIVGVIFRNWGKSDTRHKNPRNKNAAHPQGFSAAFTTSVKASSQSMLNICGFVIFFTVFIRLLFVSGFIPWLAGIIGLLLGPLGFDSQWAERLLTGVIELSSGVWSLNDAAGQLTASVAMAAFMLGWAGLSVHSQVLSFIGSSGLSVRTYIYGKLLQGILSAGFVFVIVRLLFIDAVTSTYLAEQVTYLASVDFATAGLVSILGAGIVFVLFVLGAKKAAAKSQRRA